MEVVRMFGTLGREFTSPFRHDTPLMTVSLLRTFRLYIRRRSPLKRPLRRAMQPTTALDIFKYIILFQLSHSHNYNCRRQPPPLHLFMPLHHSQPWPLHWGSLPSFHLSCCQLQSVSSHPSPSGFSASWSLLGFYPSSLAYVCHEVE